MILQADELLLLQDADLFELEDAEIDQMAGARKRNIVISPEKFQALQKRFLMRIESYKAKRRQAKEC